MMGAVKKGLDEPFLLQALVSETKAIWEDLVQRGQQIYQASVSVFLVTPRL